MSPITLPYRPNPNDQRSIAGILSNFDEILAVLNDLDMSQYLVNGSVDITDIAETLAEFLGINTATIRRGAAVSTNELSTTSTSFQDSATDLTINIPSAEYFVMGVCGVNVRQTVTIDNGMELKIRDETQAVDRALNAFIPQSDVYGTHEMNNPSGLVFMSGAWTPGNHTFGIHYRRSAGTGTVWVKDRVLQLCALKP